MKKKDSKGWLLFCNLFGHMQKECNKWKAAGSKMVDTQGKPYMPRNAGTSHP